MHREIITGLAFLGVAVLFTACLMEKREIESCRAKGTGQSKSLMRRWLGRLSMSLAVFMAKGWIVMPIVLFWNSIQK